MKAVDRKAFNEAQRRVWRLMCDKHWHSATEIIAASGQREGLRRLRELRKAGFNIAVRRVGDARNFEYRLP